MNLLLFTHITTASVNLLICMIAWVRPTHTVQSVLRVLNILSLGSGIALALEPGHFTRSFCVRLSIYLLIIIAAEYRLQRSLGQRIIPSATIVST